MVVAGFDVFPNTIRRGEFDRVLVRPVSVFVQVLSADFQLRRIGRIGQGVVALALGFAWTSIAWTPAKVAYLPIAVVSGAVIYGALTLLGAVLCFWTVQSIELINVVTYGGSELSSYPFDLSCQPTAVLHVRHPVGLCVLLSGSVPARSHRPVWHAGLAGVRDPCRGSIAHTDRRPCLERRRSPLPEHGNVAL